MDAPPLRQLLARIRSSFSPDLVARSASGGVLIDLLHDELAAPGPESAVLVRALAESVVPSA